MKLQQHKCINNKCGRHFCPQNTMRREMISICWDVPHFDSYRTFYIVKCRNGCFVFSINPVTSAIERVPLQRITHNFLPLSQPPPPPHHPSNTLKRWWQTTVKCYNRQPTKVTHLKQPWVLQILPPHMAHTIHFAQPIRSSPYSHAPENGFVYVYFGM